MTPNQIKLVRQSFETLAAQADSVTMCFYSRLFALNPDLGLKFSKEIKNCERSLFETLRLTVSKLTDKEELQSVQKHPASNNALYQLIENHYETVGVTLLWTLEKYLGADYTREVGVAWAEAYWLVAEDMRYKARTAKTERLDEQEIATSKQLQDAASNFVGLTV